MTRITPIEEGNRIPIPADWVVEMGLDKVATLEKTPDGILIHSCSPRTWDEIFAKKLHMDLSGTSTEEVVIHDEDLLF